MTINRRMMLAGSASLALVASNASLITPLYGAAFLRTEWTSTTPDGVRNRESLIRGWRAMKARPKPANPWDDVLHLDFFVWLHSIRGPHRGYFFTVWHAGFLLWFESAIRILSGDPEFSLPYLDFSKSLVLPAEFRNTSSPLYHARRNASVNSGVALPAEAAAWQGALRNSAGVLLPFTTSDGTPNFGGPPSAPLIMGPGMGTLERNPHGSIHNGIGGDMADLMTAPNDILFFLLHAWVQMLVRFWRSLGGQYPTPASDPGWIYATPFRFPESVVGAADWSVSRILGADFSYKYEAWPTLPPIPQPVMALSSTLRVASAPEVLATKWNIPLPTRKRTITLALTHPPRSGARTLLLLKRMTCEVPGVFHAVYVNLPSGVTPRPSGPYFVGNISMISHGGNCGAQDEVFDITKQVADKTTCYITLIPRGPANVLGAHTRTGVISKLIVKG